MKLIFLDIDGVLNTRDTFIKVYYSNKFKDIKDIQIEDSALESLKKIVEETGAKIILTSSWRSYFDDDLKPITEEGEKLIGKFKTYSLYIHDMVEGPSCDRGQEINNYIMNNDVKSFVIIDDEYFDYEKQGIIDHLVQTSFMTASLNMDHANKAIKMLRKNRY